MRASLSKRTKSLSASRSATQKRSPKPSSSKSVKVTLRQKTTAKAASSKKSVKPAPVAKTQKKVVVAKKKVTVAKKVTVEKIKKASPKPARVTVAKKSPTKTPSKSIKAVSKAAKPKVKIAARPSKVKIRATAPKVKIQAAPAKVKIQAAAPKRPRPTPKPVITPIRIPRQQTVTQALRAFERAVKAFNLRQFSEAKALFEELQQSFHQEVEIISRSQTYIQVCNVRLAGNRALPRNADEFYDRGVVALNVGNFTQARSFFEKALKLRPDDSHTLYSLAATHAQTGSTDQALTYLQQAVQRQPRLRQRALQDSDFSALKDDRRFLELLGATSPFDLLEARRDFS